MPHLFDPLPVGDFELRNRIVMAPMTRNRATVQGIPTDMMATYYGQRASAGLIVSESAPISARAVGYPCTPGLYTRDQVPGWRVVTEAVHAGGGKIFAQLQHCGRISHPSLQLDGGEPVAPSALRPKGQAVTYTGMQDFVTPRALQSGEIPAVIDQFKQAAQLAKEAGFDGVEVHGANGYLIDQFLRDGTNQRSDVYGGTPQKRLKLLMDAIDAVAEVWPHDHIGVRLSPENRFNDMMDSNPAVHFGGFVAELGRARLAYLHVLEGDMMTRSSVVDYAALRRRYDGIYIANNGYDKARAHAALRIGDADLIAFGAPFIANPDLVDRLKHDWPLNAPDGQTFYGGGEAGYTDYASYRVPDRCAS